MRILKGLSGRVLACGCVAGVYETYDGAVVMIIDAPAPSCGQAGHESGNIVPVAAGVTDDRPGAEGISARD